MQKIMDFIRYGSLKIQTYEDNDHQWLHAPPARRGIFAFPRGYVEPFLLGGKGIGSLQNGRYRYLRDAKGNKIKAKYSEWFNNDYDDEMGCFPVKEPHKIYLKKKHIPENSLRVLTVNGKKCEIGKYFKDSEVYILIENKPTKFKYNGLIWHHLETWEETRMCEHADVLNRVGKWILTTIRVYEKCLKKYVHMHKFYENNMVIESDRITIKRQARCDGYPMHYADKDMYEVFIEKL